MSAAISTLSHRIPYLHWIDPKTVTLSDESHASGTCVGVYRGTQNGKHVAVKVLRTSNQESLAKLMEVGAMDGREAQQVDLG